MRVPQEEPKATFSSEHLGCPERSMPHKPIWPRKCPVDGIMAAEFSHYLSLNSLGTPLPVCSWGVAVLFLVLGIGERIFFPSRGCLVSVVLALSIQYKYMLIHWPAAYASAHSSLTLIYTFTHLFTNPFIPFPSISPSKYLLTCYLSSFPSISPLFPISTHSHPFTYLSVHLSPHLSIHTSFHLSAKHLFTHLSIHTSIHASTHLFQSPAPPSDNHIFLHSCIPLHSFCSSTYHTFTWPALHLPMYISIYPFIQAYF